MQNERRKRCAVMVPEGVPRGVHGVKAHLEAPQLSFSKPSTPQPCDTHTSDALGHVRRAIERGARREVPAAPNGNLIVVKS